MNAKKTPIKKISINYFLDKFDVNPLVLYKQLLSKQLDSVPDALAVSAVSNRTIDPDTHEIVQYDAEFLLHELTTIVVSHLLKNALTPKEAISIERLMCSFYYLDENVINQNTAIMKKIRNITF